MCAHDFFFVTRKKNYSKKWEYMSRVVERKAQTHARTLTWELWEFFTTTMKRNIKLREWKFLNISAGCVCVCVFEENPIFLFLFHFKSLIFFLYHITCHTKYHVTVFSKFSIYIFFELSSALFSQEIDRIFMELFINHHT